MLLETTVNILDHATHARLYKELMAFIGHSLGKEGRHPVYLHIAENSEGCVDATYNKGIVATALLKEHPDLQTELWRAWKAKSLVT